MPGWFECLLLTERNRKWVPAEVLRVAEGGGCAALDSAACRLLEEEAYTATGDDGRAWANLWKVLVISGLVIVCDCLANGLLTVVENGYRERGREVPRMRRFVVEFTLLVVPLVAVLTSPMSSTEELQLCSIMGGLALGVFFLSADSTPQQQFRLFVREMLKPPQVDENRVTMLSQTRSHIMLFVSLVICAVDFLTFSRDHVKSKAFGFTLMDAGVGLAILSSALISPAALHRSDAERADKMARRFVCGKSRLMTLSATTCLGLMTLLFKRQTDYHTPATEYGVHWNFFFSLGIALGVGDCIATAVTAKWTWLMGLLISVGHQYFLSKWNLDDFILHAPRVDLFSANREGVIGSIGFVALYLIGTSLGACIQQMKTDKRSRLAVIGTLLALGGAATALMVLAEANLGFSPSRRMVNFAFVAAVVALLSFLMALETAADALTVGCPGVGQRLMLLRGVNENQILFFLAANALTGCFKLASKCSLAQPLAVAFATLFLYAFCLSGTAFEFGMRRWALRPSLILRSSELGSTKEH